MLKLTIVNVETGEQKKISSYETTSGAAMSKAGYPVTEWSVLWQERVYPELEDDDDDDYGYMPTPFWGCPRYW